MCNDRAAKHAHAEQASSASEAEDVCSICLCELEDEEQPKACGHCFHEDCLASYFTITNFGAGKFLGIACPTMGCERECDSREIREAVDDEAFAQCSSGRCPKGDWRSTTPQDFCVFEIGGRA